MDRTVSPERWLHLTARGGVLTAEQYGFTHRPETRVFGWRTVPCHIFYLCLDGGFKVSFEAQTVELRKGSFLWMMPHIQNQTQLLAQRKSFRTYYFRFTLAEED